MDETPIKERKSFRFWHDTVQMLADLARWLRKNATATLEELISTAWSRERSRQAEREAQGATSHVA